MGDVRCVCSSVRLYHPELAGEAPRRGAGPLRHLSLGPGGWAGSQHPAALDGMQTCVWDKGQAHTSSARVHSHTPRRCVREKSKSGPGCPTLQMAQRHRGGREERTVWVESQPLPPKNGETLGELPPPSEPQFPHLPTGLRTRTSQAVARISLDHTCDKVRTVPVRRPPGVRRLLLCCCPH